MTDNAFRKIKHTLTQASALGIRDLKTKTKQTKNNFFLSVSKKASNCIGGLDPKARTRTLPSNILFKEVRQSECWMATLPEHKSSYSCTNRRSYKVSFGTETRSSDSPSGQSYSGDKTLLVVNRATAYQASCYALRHPWDYYKNFHYYLTLLLWGLQAQMLAALVNK